MLADDQIEQLMKDTSIQRVAAASATDAAPNAATDTLLDINDGVSTATS